MNFPVIVHSHSCGGPERGGKPVAADSFPPMWRGRGLFPRNLNSAGSQGARNLTARSLIEKRQQPFSIFGQVNHFNRLRVSVAAAFHEQKRNSGVLENVPKALGEITNV